MLIEFTVANYRSFREPATLSMLAAKIKAKDERLDRNNVFQVESQPSLLTSAAIYGRNASGKSNLVRALSFMRSFVLQSTGGTEGLGSIQVEPFRLCTATIDQPSFFEVVFVMDSVRYRYGFEATAQRVHAEWLYAVPKSTEALLFRRSMGEIKLGKTFKEGRDRIQLTRPNALFLSVLAQFNAPSARKLIAWFRKLGVLSGIADTSIRIYTLNRLMEGRDVEVITRVLTSLDTGVEGLRVEKGIKVAPPSLPPEMPESIRSALQMLMDSPDVEHVSVNTTHTVYDEDGQPLAKTEFDIDDQESEGTRRLFALAGPLVNTLAEGRVLVIDEFDARFHPLLTRQILELFNDPFVNQRHAQLVVLTHDTGLLDNSLLRRDQIWFVEKDSKGASTLYSLAEFKGVRNDKDYARGYLEGRYGAIPYVHFLAESIASYEVDDAEKEN